jgi:hypothetical protein
LGRRGFSAEARVPADFFFRVDGDGLEGTVTSAGVDSSTTASTSVTTENASPRVFEALTLRAFFSDFFNFLADLFSAFLAFLPFFSFPMSELPLDFSFLAAFFLFFLSTKSASDSGDCRAEEDFFAATMMNSCMRRVRVIVGRIPLFV